MEVTFHLPVSLIAKLISRTLGGQTRLGLRKFTNTLTYTVGFLFLTERVPSQFVGATGVGFALVVLEHREPAYHDWRISHTLRYLCNTLDATL